MTYRSRDDKGISADGYWTDKWISTEEPEEPKPRLNWLLLAALTLNLGVWVGILTWWIWR